MTVLSVQNIVKTYGIVKALADVSFDVPAGAVYGILGPNGSGKTTLLGIVMNVLHATSGSYSWNGSNGNEADQRKQIGTLLETPNFYPYLSATKNLEIAAAIKSCNNKDIDRVLKIVNLYERKDSAFRTYSLGMKQRLAIAAALLGDPKILVFDEPTNGLDPAGIAEIRELIKQLHRSGKTIIMASHILDEVEKVCTHVAIIQKGVLKTSGTVQSVLAVDGKEENIFEIAAANNDVLKAIIENMAGINTVIPHGELLQVSANEEISAAVINQYCFNNGIVLSSLNIKKHNLEKRFLEITGNSSDR